MSYPTIYLLTPLRGICRTWLMRNVSSDSSWFGKALVVEHGYIEGLVETMRREGFRDGIDFEVVSG